MGITTFITHDKDELVCYSMDSQNMDTTFGSWRELYPDNDTMVMETEWHRYLNAGHVKGGKAFSV